MHHMNDAFFGAFGLIVHHHFTPSTSLFRFQGTSKRRVRCMSCGNYSEVAGGWLFFWLLLGACVAKDGDDESRPVSWSQKSDHPKLGPYDLESFYFIRRNYAEISETRNLINTWMKDQVFNCLDIT